MNQAASHSAQAPAFDEAWFAARAQPGVQRLKAYDPGHDLVALRRKFGEANLAELGSNENPYGPSPAARQAILDSLHALHRYPDPLGADLKRALAARHGVDVKQIQLGNGSHELLMQLGQVFAGPGDEIVFSRYGFAVFALSTQAAGAQMRIVEALPRDAAMPNGHDLDAIAAAVGPATRLVYVANPNNPTGTWFGRDALIAFLDRVPSEVIVVMDEAYAEMADAPDYASALSLLDRYPNLAITRTFSKAYGLAGLRVGYLLAQPGLIAVMDRLRESFNVNGPGLAACEAALGDVEHLHWACARNAEQRSALSEALGKRGLRVFPSQTNFVLVEFGARTPQIEASLVERGVILRPMGGYGLADCIRISVGSPDENRRLLAALDEVLA
ncbi:MULTISPECIES: histidinol-phosphate transaminase [unclassified Lysobacter]|uniref:histidinol-phosphate transaminase n=1 Tax=unclassified Lysobacter TaxID=2635362 RepID=UPI001BE53E10|nr:MULTISPECIES: histidinol-phosphate transaminase [unclassified Lysobacter]MBT2746866.1 histidinol-phosphate transaminase [Lysobacter sp. ISL-42]MBT2750649.1 histidinol-phosphate transaminase [Lysobacter sp. ISL-50]MBT2779478.1 histidinol-phosphate transaminase [Lysobacter sp. ISL-54]MBT2784687.1 histidinol-phosphate transaminase [Lysobacter sp. ISL-52]